MSLLVRINGIAGLQSYSCGASSIDFTGGGVNVNGSAATYSVVGDFVVISSPVIAGGDIIEVNGTPSAAVEDVSVLNFPTTQPVSFPSAQHVIVDSMPGGGSSADVTDRVGRLLGHVNVDNWPATQPVSIATNTPDVTDRSARLLGHVTVDNSSLAVTAASLPLPSGAATDSNLNTIQGSAGTSPPALAASASGLLGWLRKIVDVLSGSIAVTGTFWQATQPISAASLPLPSGAATAAKQPALGTAGAASADVLSVQGVASMIALKVDGSAVTQPVSGTVTANAGTNLNTSALALDATLTGNNARMRITDGTNLAAVKAASTAPAAADPALVVALSPNMGPVSNSILPSAAATINATVVKASAGRLYKIKGYNAAAAVRYIKFWNKATTPAPASDTALIVFSFALKASDQFDIDLTPVGYAFSSGLSYTLSTGSANNDATAVTAADIVGLNVLYA
jgi:hypothetical protein